MTDNEALALADRCLRAFLRCDITAAPFDDVLSRGLTRIASDVGSGALLKEGEIQWDSLHLQERRAFPGFEAILLNVETSKSGEVKLLIGVDEMGLVCEFGYDHYLGTRPQEPQTHLFWNPFQIVARRSAFYKLQGLMIPSLGLGISGNRLPGDHVVVTIGVPNEYWEKLDPADVQKLLDDLKPLALHAYWLQFSDAGSRDFVKIVILRSQEPTIIDGIQRITWHAGDPQAHEILADRFVTIPKLRASS